LLAGQGDHRALLAVVTRGTRLARRLTRLVLVGPSGAAGALVHARIGCHLARVRVRVRVRSRVSSRVRVRVRVRDRARVRARVRVRARARVRVRVRVRVTVRNRVTVGFGLGFGLGATEPAAHGICSTLAGGAK